MIKIARSPYAAALLALSALTAPQALAQQPVDGMVVVDTDGRLMRDVPEAGAVRIVIDTEGRRLLLDTWDQVIGFEIPAWQYRQQNGGQRPRMRDRIESAFPAPPPPPREAYPRDGFDGGLYERDGFAAAPPADGIERRDLNPMTGTVPGERTREPGLSGPQDTPEVIEAPRFVEPAMPAQPAAPKLTKAQVAALQVFLDRNGVSPGVIDGRMGSNVSKALDAWFEETGERIDPADTDLIVSRLAASGGLAFTSYTITSEDAAGPFIASIPSDYAEKARLERLAYTSTVEMLAERFHMDEDYLKALNPGADFSRPGVQIKVVEPGQKRTGKVASIVADKARKQVRGYDANGKLVVAYPTTIGSSDTPSPTGQVTIERVARNPGYTYNPKVNFKQGDNDQILEVPPGPNGPVGTIWIALSKPTYGIHGTPEPSKIGKTASHGCVRLTNWDAEELAGLVTPGVTVSFVD
ncbi:L,D-transpeptidase [Hoeflea sp. BAL378]|uniref:L,D-transpeptidase n=1 Tax=Hoeflea sp. BAL378 TaxID=1547437 RepID=UPI00068F0DC8|nr:L,D-transpeptidase [Hoeflea sp. BAL378]